MYDLINIFEIFLPQLLLYPNPTDPLNPEAAQLQLRYEQRYLDKIKQYVEKYASDKELFKTEELTVVKSKVSPLQQTSAQNKGKT